MEEIERKLDPADLPVAQWKLNLGKATVWLLMKLLGPVVGFGASEIPAKGGVLVLANHRSDVDVIMLQYCCPRAIRYMAKSELFDMPVVKHGAKLFRAFPIHRDSSDRAALRYAIELLKAGQIVGIFPEGETSETGEPLPLKPGIALIAKSSGVPVICAGLKGTARILPYSKLIPRPAFRKVIVRFGQPFHYSDFENAEAFLTFVASEFERLSA